MNTSKAPVPSANWAARRPRNRGTNTEAAIPRAYNAHTTKLAMMNLSVAQSARVAWAAWTDCAASHGLQLTCSGHPAMPFVRFTSDDDMYRNQVWCGEMARRGVFVHPHHNLFVSTAHTQEDVNRTIEAADGAFRVVKEQFGS